MSTEIATRPPTDMAAVVKQVTDLLDAVPTVDDDPTPKMAEAILTAQDPSDWASVFEGKSIKENAGAKVRFHAIRKLPSSFDGLVPSYLVADITNLDTGEVDVMSVSSTMSILQLLVAHQRGWFPLDAEIVKKERPTARGFHPIHLKAIERPKQVKGKV